MANSVLIVGASGGIGRAIACGFAAKGWHVLAHGRDEAALAGTLAAVETAGGTGETFQAELTNDLGVQGVANWAADRSSLDAVIVSAGGGRSVDSGPDAISEWQRTLQTTLHAPMALVARTLPAMRQSEGHYLFICGMYAKMGMARMAAHCAGRHGMEGFAKALFEEVREDGVGVTLLHPGFVYTGLTNTQTLDPERMIHAQDIADMAVLAVTQNNRACVTEMIVRPQRSPYR